MKASKYIEHLQYNREVVRDISGELRNCLAAFRGFGDGISCLLDNEDFKDGASGTDFYFLFLPVLEKFEAQIVQLEQQVYQDNKGGG